jgi:hypothetical protein
MGKAAGYGLEITRLNSGMVNFFLFSTVSRPTMEPTQPFNQSVRGQSGRGVKVTTHLNLVQRSRMVKLYLRPFASIT